MQVSTAAVGLWILSLVFGAAAEVRMLSLDDIVMRTSWICLEFLMASSSVAVVVAIVLLRTGVATDPVATVMLTAISVTALGSLDLELFHRLNTNTELLLWHVSKIAVILAMARAGGPPLLKRIALMNAARCSCLP